MNQETNQVSKGEIRTAEEIFKGVPPAEAPILTFRLTNPLGEVVTTALQDTHCTPDQLKEVLGDAKFKYIGETSDRIPQYSFEGTEAEARKLIDVEVELNPQLKVDEEVQLHITPKNHPYGQYYEVTSNRTLTDLEGDEVGIPMKLQEAIDAQG